MHHDDEGARVAMSWEAPAARRRLEDWLRLLDDLGWDEIPPSPAVLTDLGRYQQMLEAQRQAANEELHYVAGKRRVLNASRPIVDEDLEQILVCDQILRRISAVL